MANFRSITIQDRPKEVTLSDLILQIRVRPWHNESNRQQRATQLRGLASLIVDLSAYERGLVVLTPDEFLAGAFGAPPEGVSPVKAHELKVLEVPNRYAKLLLHLLDEGEVSDVYGFNPDWHPDVIALVSDVVEDPSPDPSQGMGANVAALVFHGGSLKQVDGAFTCAVVVDYTGTDQYFSWISAAVRHVGTPVQVSGDPRELIIGADEPACRRSVTYATTFSSPTDLPESPKLQYEAVRSSLKRTTEMQPVEVTRVEYDKQP